MPLYTLIAVRPSKHMRYSDECDVQAESHMVESGLSLEKLENRIAELGTLKHDPYTNFHAFLDAEQNESERLTREIIEKRVTPVLDERKAKQKAEMEAHVQLVKQKRLLEAQSELTRIQKEIDKLLD